MTVIYLWDTGGSTGAACVGLEAYSIIGLKNKKGASICKFHIVVSYIAKMAKLLLDTIIY